MGPNFLFYFCWLALTVFLGIKVRSTKDCLAFSREKLPAQLAFAIGLAAILIGAIAAVNIAVAGAFYPFPIFVYASFYGAKTIAVVLAFQLLVAVVEEFFFRGWLLTLQLAKGFPRWAAVLTNGLLFGLLHLATTRSWISFLFSFVCGLVFSFAKTRFRHCSIYSLVLAHLIYNLSITA